MEKVVGIDLAGMDKNPTGIAILQDKNVSVSCAFRDEDILSVLEKAKPRLVAIDAPLSKPKEGPFREADLILREYGTLPLNMRGMVQLLERGMRLKTKINFPIIEVFPRATSLILGYYAKGEQVLQKNLIGLGIEGDIERRLLSKDELDAISAAITAQLFLSGKAKEVGGDEGKIVVPEV